MTEAQRYRLANSVYSFGHYMERIGAPPAEVRTGPPGIVGVIIHDAVRSFTNPIYGYAKPFEKDCTALFARLLESKHSILVASRGEIVVGALGMSLNPVPRIGSIEFLGTFDDQERQGIGSKLLREAVLRARSNGWVRLQVEWPKSGPRFEFLREAWVESSKHPSEDLGWKRGRLGHLVAGVMTRQRGSRRSIAFVGRPQNAQDAL